MGLRKNNKSIRFDDILISKIIRLINLQKKTKHTILLKVSVQNGSLGETLIYDPKSFRWFMETYNDTNVVSVIARRINKRILYFYANIKYKTNIR